MITNSTELIVDFDRVSSRWLKRLKSFAQVWSSPILCSAVSCSNSIEIEEIGIEKRLIELQASGWLFEDEMQIFICPDCALSRNDRIEEIRQSMKMITWEIPNR